MAGLSLLLPRKAPFSLGMSRVRTELDKSRIGATSAHSLASHRDIMFARIIYRLQLFGTSSRPRQSIGSILRCKLPVSGKPLRYVRTIVEIAWSLPNELSHVPKGV